MTQEKFSKWRTRLWPIHSFELRKVVPLILMKFFISFIYSIFLMMKDTLIITGEGSGAEVIPVLKGGVVLPAAMIITLLYAKLTNKYKRSTIFYGTITAFLAFILLYSFLLYPNRELLSPVSSANWMLAKVGPNYSHWIAIYRNWMQSIFFVVAELWAPLVIFVLFWGLCNQINVLDEAKRYYTLFAVAGDLGTVLSGPLIIYYARKFAGYDYLVTVQALSICMLFFCVLIIALHWWIVRYCVTNQTVAAPSIQMKTKTKLSLMQGLKYIASSSYLRYIAVMVVAYGLAINMVDVPWKANVKLLYPNPSDFQEFTARVNSVIGMVALITAFFISGNVIRTLGWRFSALVSPIMLGCTSTVFFLLLITKNIFGMSIFGIDPLIAVVYFGAFQCIVSKSIKYSLFDPTKEMAFIPLDQESKVKGKAAIDVVGSRLGKSGSSWIQLLLLQLASAGSVLAISGFLLPIVALTTVYWAFSVNALHKEFEKKSGSAEKEPAVSSL